jgi:hypothetical protein
MLLQLEPKNLNFKEVFKGEASTLSLSVIPWRGTKFNITDVEPPTPHFEVQISPDVGIARTLKSALESAKERIMDKFSAQEAVADTMPEKPAKKPDPNIDPENARTISVTLLPTAPIGRQYGTLKVHTDLEEKPVLDVRISASVVGNIKVEPQHFNFGNVKMGEGKETTFKITARETVVVDVTSIETSSEHVSASLVDTTPSSAYELKVSIGSGAPIGRLHGNVILHTTDRDQPELKVRFFANVVE